MENIEKLIQELLAIICQDCDGENYGCRGCRRQEEIATILNKYGIE